MASRSPESLVGLGTLLRHALEEMDEVTWQDMIDVNLTGLWHAAKAAIPHLRAAGGGSIILTSSTAGLKAIPNTGHYNSAKHGVVGLMRTLAQVLTEEYSEHGVHVANVVIDGLIDSPGTRELPMAQKRPDIVMNPVKIAEAFYYLHTQDRSCWTHELQLTPFPTKPSY